MLEHQPAKFAAIEARWKTQQPASGVLIALPDETRELNLFAIEIPRLGSFIASGNWTAREIWLETFPPEDRPPVLIPLFGFRIMVGMGLIMLAISWFGCFLRLRARLETTRWFLWGRPSPSRAASSPSSPAGSPLRSGASRGSCTGCCDTSEAVTPSLTTDDVLVSLAGYILVYAGFVSFGVYYIYKLLREGPTAEAKAIPRATGRRPMAFADTAETAAGGGFRAEG